MGDHAEMELKEEGRKDVDCIRLPQARNQWLALANTLMDLRVPRKGRECLTSYRFFVSQEKFPSA
jgi:hypothetical protein